VRHCCPNRKLANERGEKHDTEVIADSIGSPASIPGATLVRCDIAFHQIRAVGPEAAAILGDGSFERRPASYDLAHDGSDFAVSGTGSRPTRAGAGFWRGDCNRFWWRAGRGCRCRCRERYVALIAHYASRPCQAVGHMRLIEVCMLASLGPGNLRGATAREGEAHV
jgi:hypothetical protein